MINFLIKIYYWLRGRKAREWGYDHPYFWGPPDDYEAYLRYETFKCATGHPDTNPDVRRRLNE